MMDALSAPRPPVSDSASSSSGSGRSDRTEDGGSFSKVLSNSGEHDRGAKGKESATDGQAEAETSDGPGRSAHASRQGPVDIGNMLEGELEGLSADLSVDDLARLLAALKAQGKGKADTKGDAGPQVEIEGLDPKLKAELAKAMAVVRDRKGSGEGDQTASEPGAAEETATDGQTVDLVDVLKLLSGGEGAKAGLEDPKANNEKNAKDDPKAKLADGLGVPAATEQSGDTSSSGERGEQGGRDFRFIRADGKGQPLLLRGDGANGAEQAEQKTVETVTVVDSRRYIAPVSSANGASITAAMVGDGEWISAMSPGSELANAAAQSSHGKVVHTLKIQMTPIELGSVTATLRLSGEELSVQLTVDNPAALRQLSHDQSDILKALRAQGLVVDQVQVNMQVVSTDRGADAGQNAPQGQQNGQQAFQSGSQGGSERQQQSDTAANGAGTGDERRVQATDTAAPDTRGTNPGQLYL